MAPRLNAEVLLAHAMHCQRVYFHAHPEQTLRQVEWLHYGRYLDERIRGKPTQYITQKQEFWGREFRVGPAVLIPRPETELLVERVLHLADLHPVQGAKLLIDIGTGSGAIAVTLALTMSDARTCATDVSRDALQIARINAATHGAGVQFIEADLLTPFGDEIANVVVSNPPYVPLSDLPAMQREVRDYEPHLALFAGSTGLEIYRCLIPEAWRVLKPGGLLALELGFGLAESVRALVDGWSDVQIVSDLSGIPRVLSAKK